MSRLCAISDLALGALVMQIREAYALWHELSNQMDILQMVSLPCPENTSNTIDEALRQLHEDASELETVLVEQKLIVRRDLFQASKILFIVQRTDTDFPGYSLERFSPGWFEMLDDFFPAESKERGTIAA